MKVCKHAQIWSKLHLLQSKFGSIQFWIVFPQFAQLTQNAVRTSDGAQALNIRRWIGIRLVPLGTLLFSMLGHLLAASETFSDEYVKILWLTESPFSSGK